MAAKEGAEQNLQVHIRMTKQEEIELLKNADDGDRDSLLVLANEGLRLCTLVARKYENKGEIENLIRAGFRGWILAYKHFDRSKNYKFSTYSTWWIKEEIEKNLKS